MANLMDINMFPGFLLILVRILAFFATVPIFSYRNIPNTFKIGLGFFLAWITFYTIEIPELAFDEQYILLIGKEALVGLLIGLFAYIIMAAIQVAGGFIDFQMGFAIANVIDPQTGAQSPITGQYLYIIAILFLLLIDGHHLLIHGLLYSFDIISLEQFISIENPELILVGFAQMFLIAFQLAIPIVGSLFLVDVALGLIARTVPQLNVFVVGLPLKIFVAFVMLLLFIPFYTMIVRKLFQYILEMMKALIHLLGGA